MAKITTKDRILEAALTQFAEKGYDGVGVDLIAENAGLKGPSLYKHFKGKEGILDALIDQASLHYEMNFGSDRDPGKLPGSIEELIQLSMGRIRFTVGDPMIRKVRRILAMEQFRSPKIAELATKHSMEGVQSMYTMIFTGMMEAGTIRKMDPHVTAMAFAAPVTLLVNRCDREPENTEEILRDIEAFMKDFAENFLRP